MSAAPELRVGVIGYGVMGKAHCYAYRIAPMLRTLPVTPVVSVMSGRSRAGVEAAAAAYGVPACTTDWRGLIARDDIAIVDICTPPGTHAEMAQAAAAAGKAVLCEKPLALSYPEAAGALAAVDRAGVRNAVGFNYRRLPAVALMHRMVGEGAVGEVRLWRATWLSDEFTDPDTPFDWRFDRAMGGTTMVFDYARLNELRYGRADDEPGLYGMRRIRAEHPSHPYAADWWPLGQGVGYGSSFGNQVADLLEGWPDAPWSPGFRQGAAVQAVCDAMEASAAQGRWVAVTEVTEAGPG